MKNNSIKKCEICNNEEIGEFITIGNKKIHLNCILDLIQEKQDLIKYLEDKIEECNKYLEYPRWRSKQEVYQEILDKVKEGK